MLRRRRYRTHRDGREPGAGRLSTNSLLGGALSLNFEAARRVIEEKIAAGLQCTVEEAAEGIIRVINASMTAAIRKLTVERGYDPRLFTLVPFGGAGPLHGVELARELGIRDVVVPLAPGGRFGRGPRFFKPSFGPDPDPRRTAGSNRGFGIREDAGRTDRTGGEDLSTSSATGHPVISRRVGLRYAGQGYDIPIDLPEGAVDLALLGSAFHLEHERQYGFARRDQRFNSSTCGCLRNW